MGQEEKVGEEDEHDCESDDESDVGVAFDSLCHASHWSEWEKKISV